MRSFSTGVQKSTKTKKSVFIAILARTLHKNISQFGRVPARACRAILSMLAWDGVTGNSISRRMKLKPVSLLSIGGSTAVVAAT